MRIIAKPPDNIQNEYKNCSINEKTSSLRTEAINPQSISISNKPALAPVLNL